MNFSAVVIMAAAVAVAATIAVALIATLTLYGSSATVLIHFALKLISIWKLKKIKQGQ